MHIVFHKISVDTFKMSRFGPVRKFCERFNPFRFYLCAKIEREYGKLYEAVVEAQ